MINPVYNISNLARINSSAPNSTPKLSYPEDVFICRTPKLEIAKKDARNKIVEYINNKNVEYGFIIAPDGSILDENEGTESSCGVDSRKVKSGSVLMHGHPIPYPLSSGDIAVLLATKASSIEAVTRDGKFSRLTKEHPEIISPDYSQTYIDFEKRLNLKALDVLGVDYTLNINDIIQMFKDYCSNNCIPINGKSDEELIKFMSAFDIDINDGLEKAKKQLEDMMSFALLFTPKKYDKEHNAILDNMPAIKALLDSDEGIILRNDFVKEIASELGLVYETNLFE